MLPTTTVGGMKDLLFTTTAEAVAATAEEAEEVTLLHGLNNYKDTKP
jgi:hypothetical protein